MHYVTVEELGLDDDFFKMTDREIFDGLQELGYIDKDVVFVEGNYSKEREENGKQQEG